MEGDLDFGMAFLRLITSRLTQLLEHMQCIRLDVGAAAS